MKAFSGYRHAWSMLRQYWAAYGGAAALFFSPYFQISIVFLLFGLEWRQNFNWADDAVDVVPSILGFSLGAFAIFLALADEKFVTILTKKIGPATTKNTAYLKISALFVHFMLVQAIAILFALLSREFQYTSYLTFFQKFVSGAGYFFFIYSIFTAVAIALNLLRLALLYNKYKGIENQDEDGNVER